MLIMYASSIEYTGSLTSSECRACKSKKTTQMKDDFDFIFHCLDFASDDVNKNLQALFSCPKKWRYMPRKRLDRTGNSAVFTDEQDD